MDHFMEEVVVKRNRGMSSVLYVLANVVMVISAILGFMYLQVLFVQFNVFGLIQTLAMLGIAVLLFLRRDRLRTEYEYTFTNGDLDFAQVFNNQKRKTLGTMRVKNVESFGPVDSNAFRKFINMPGMKRRNWFLNRDAKLYYFYYQKESAKNIIVFEPSDELVDMIRKYLPHGVYQE
ncbi:MAG: hypothetical protein PUD16_12000 [bacterium]|nr:hypothetical protein [bacterium]